MLPSASGCGDDGQLADVVSCHIHPMLVASLELLHFARRDGTVDRATFAIAAVSPVPSALAQLEGWPTCAPLRGLRAWGDEVARGRLA